MYCHHCGTSIYNNSIFCSVCGEKQESQNTQNKPTLSASQSRRVSARTDRFKSHKSILGREVIVTIKILFLSALIYPLAYLCARYMYYDPSGLVHSESAYYEVRHGIPWMSLNNKSLLDWHADDLSWDFAEEAFYYVLFGIIGGRYFLILVTWAKNT
jgi:hypothetical protein